MRPIPSLTRKLVSASGIALATAMIAKAPVAQAQSFQGTVDSTFGSVSVINGANTTDVFISSDTAVINWTPNDQAATGGPINFQTAGTTATFTGNSGSGADFAVLNRIIPVGSTRPIQFNGTVVSQLQISGPPVAGGRVFFYSPGGILLGSNAVFDVGSLALTASDLSYDAAGNFDSSGSYVFQPATVPGAQIRVLPGAQISTSVNGSYVAMVAPSVVNEGTINVNGSAALVAADAATITFSPNGLFDIQVDSGTSATGTVAANNGTITGPAAAPTFFHRVYMVAVAKNDAITMAIGSGSTLGFDIAGAANVVGNAVVLSAGHDVVAGSAGIAPSAGGGTGQVSITGGDANITSNFVATANGGVNLGSVSATGLDFASNVVISASGAGSSLFADAGGVVTVAGDLTIVGDVAGTDPAVSAIGRSAALLADGGTVTVGGDVSLSSVGRGASATLAGAVGGTGMGGETRIEASNGGQIVVSGNAILDSTGFGGQVVLSDTAGGSGIGGNASVLATGSSGSSVQILQSIGLVAGGLGAPGSGCSTCVTSSGNGTGGTITIGAAGSNSIGISGITVANADGMAGDTSVGGAGAGNGGAVNIAATDGGTLVAHYVSASANGTGGDGPTSAGRGQGGTIEVSTSGAGAGGATLAGEVSLAAEGYGGGATAAGGSAARGFGGTVFVSAQDGTTLQFNDALIASANGTGGFGDAGSTAGLGGETRLDAATGGTVNIAQGTTLTANAIGGNYGGASTGFVSLGGVAQITLASSGNISLGSGLLIAANASSSNGIGNAIPGNAHAGTATIVGTGGGALSVVGNANVLAIANGGAASGGPLAQGAAGVGGTASLELTGAQANFGAGLTFDATGIGGNGTAVSGSGLGGNAFISLLDSALTVTGDVYLGAIGAGGNTLSAGSGGNAFGGNATTALSNSSANLAGNLTLEVTGLGGVSVAPSPTSGGGGNATVSVNAGSLTVGNAMLLLADGQGGRGLVSADGGVGTGGAITLAANGDSRGNSVIAADTYSLRANGVGGEGYGAASSSPPNGAFAGSDGGGAVGGTIFVNAAADGGTISGSLLEISATALGGIGGDGFSSPTLATPGGNGGNGGSGQGGSITLDSARGTGTGTGALSFANMTLDVSGTGESGGNGAPGTTQGLGGNGGFGTGGTISATLDRGGSRLLVGDFLLTAAQGIGGNAGACGIGCLATGGTATGGSIFIGSNGATTGNVLSVAGQLRADARADGGDGQGGAAGNGTGGTVLLRGDSGLALDAGVVALVGSATGGDAISSGVAGAALGGNARFVGAGTGTVTVASTVSVTTEGTGGDGLGGSALGGAGTGGTSRVAGEGATMALQGDVYVIANGFGGAGNQNFASGSGGTGTGGLATVTAGVPTFLGNGSEITISGLTFVTADGVGGDAWVAGDGIGGRARVYARQGTLSLGTVLLGARGQGGFGVSGGTGGAGYGGVIDMVADNAIEVPGSITFAQAIVDGSASGGAGGQPDVPGTIGGNGGLAEGGSVVVAGSAGNGFLVGGVVVANSDAIGGDGGAGSGAAGGSGGSAIAGFVQIGSISGIDTGTLNIGSASYTAIGASANATGGAGGAGSSAIAGAIGGNGGDAIGGGVSLLVRGSPVTITGTSTFSSFEASATGGAGGAGFATGNGGDAAIGNADPLLLAGAGALITSRFELPSQPGALNATNLIFLSTATGGAGATDGSSTNLGGAIKFRAINSSIDATSMTFLSGASEQGPGATPDAIAFTGADATISGTLQFDSTQSVSLTLDQSTLTADQVGISGANWVLDPVAPIALGTLVGTTSISLSSGLDLVAHANLQAQGALTLVALGNIDFGALTALGLVDVTAGGTLSLDDISSGDSIDLTALGAIATGNITAATSITIDTVGNVTTGNLAAGSGTPNGANGALNSVAINAGGNVATGTVFAASDFGIAAAGSISIGQATAYDMQLLGGTGVSTGGLNAVNRILIANAAMSALGLTATGYDKEIVFAATPVVPVAGAIAIAGPVTATAFTAASQSTFTSGAITVAPSATGSGRLSIDAGGALSATDLTAANALDLRSAASILTGNLVSQSSSATLVAPLVQIGAVQSATDLSITGDTLDTGSLSTTAGSIDLLATNAVVTGALTAAEFVDVSADGTVSLGDVSAGRSIGLSALGDIFTGSLLASAGSISIDGTATVSTGALTATDFVFVTADAALSLGTVSSGDSISLAALGDIATGDLSATSGSISILGEQAISTGALTATSFVDVTAGDALSLGAVLSGDSIDLAALGDIATGNLTAATSITFDTLGNVLAGNLAAGTGTPSGANGDLYSVGIRAGGSVRTGTIFAASDLGIVGGTAITIGQATAYDMLLLSAGSVTTGGITASNRVLIANAAMVALGQTATGFNKEPVFAATTIAPAAGAIAIGGPVSARAFTAATLSAFSSGSITVTPSATASGRLRIDAGGALLATDLTAANALDLRSAVAINAGDLVSQSGNATITAPLVDVGSVRGVGGVSVSGQTVATGNLAASAGSVIATGTQTVSTGAITADAAITVAGGSQTTVQSASATNGLISVTSSGALGIGSVSASAGAVRLIAGVSAANGGLVAGQGSINAGSVQGSGLIQLAAGGAVSTGTLQSNAQGVKVASFGSTVNTGTINARTDVLVSAAQSLTIGGNIFARDIAVLSGGNISTGGLFAGAVLGQSPTGAVTITNATGRVLLASASMAGPGLLLSSATDYSALFAASPVRLAGTVNVGSAVAGRFGSFSQGNMTGGSIAAFGSVAVESGGLVTVAQRWGSPSLIIASADIRIIDNGSLPAGPTGAPVVSGIRTTPTGSISLISIGSSPALIGDGLSGSGYSLSSAEIALVSGGELAIGAVDVAANPVDMLIGNLALTAGGDIGQSNAAGQTGRIVFGTGNRETQTPGGAIRIVGNVTGTGFAQSNVIEFATGRFEIDAATGSLSLTQSGTALGGTVEIAATNIHVASGAILDRLAANPFYDGHVADLNRPATVQRPDGVLRALGLDLSPTGTLYIQNTGTVLDPAGFFADFELTDVTTPTNAAPASLSVIVNGKWQTPTGIVGGIDARDLVVNNAESLTVFTADSSVNGCAINASACITEMAMDPVAAIASQIQVVTNDTLGNTPQFTEEPPAAPEPGGGEPAEAQAQEDAASETDAAASPIAPPPQIIDSSPLEPESLIEQPVAGSGNPSLIGSVVDEGSAEGEGL